MGTRIPLRGVVTADGFHPLENAVILNLNSGDWTLSDEWGVFIIQDLNPQDTLLVSRYGYFSDTLYAAGLNDVSIILLKNPLKMAGIQVKGNSTGWPGLPKSPSLARITRVIPALSLKSYGGQAGIKNLSIEAGSPTHTKILFEGVDLTSSQNGETDLSQIPDYLIESLSFSRSAFLSHGSGAMDGAILLRYGEKSNQVELSGGSYDYQSAAASFSLKARGWRLNSALGVSENSGNFPVTEGSFKRRQNNDFKQSFFMGRIKRLYNNSGFFTASILTTRQKRGVAGSIISPSPEARRNDGLDIIAVRTGIFFRNNLILSSLSRRFSRETYVNPQFAQNSRHDIENLQLKGSWEWRPISIWKVKGLLQLQRQDISSSDVKAPARKYGSAALTHEFLLFPGLDFLAGFRIDREAGNYTEKTWQTKINFQILNSILISGSGGNAFRYPTFNDLYWLPGGNPELEPEFTDYAALELAIKYPHHNLSFRYSLKSSRNLIQWAPAAGNIWSPVNLKSTSRETFTLALDGDLNIIKYRTHLSRLKARDNSARKRLKHTPEYIGFLGLGTAWNRFEGYLSIAYTGKQISFYSWPENVLMRAYKTVNFTLEFQLPVLTLVKVRLLFENILDENYYTIRHYPEPGRNLKISIIIKDTD